MITRELNQRKLRDKQINQIINMTQRMTDLTEVLKQTKKSTQRKISKRDTNNFKPLEPTVAKFINSNQGVVKVKMPKQILSKFMKEHQTNWKLSPLNKKMSVGSKDPNRNTFSQLPTYPSVPQQEVTQNNDLKTLLTNIDPQK